MAAMDPRPAAESRAQIVHWMGLNDANSVGFVHGGTVMKLCDEAAGLAAIRHSRRRAVTAAVDRMTFLHPVYVGELLTLSASVNAISAGSGAWCSVMRNLPDRKTCTSSSGSS